MLTRAKVRNAVIPAAGYGTRMLPATKAIPKEMLPVAGKPLIRHAVEEAAASGIETVILVLRSDESLPQTHFRRNPELEIFLEERQQTAEGEHVRRLTRLAEIVYVWQERPLGLAHAISCVQSVVGEETFAVLLPDVIMLAEIPVTLQLLRARQQQGGSIVAIREVEACAVERHGIVSADPTGVHSSNNTVRVTNLVEKPTPTQACSRFGVFGRYLLEPAVWDFIAQTPADRRGEVQLTDALCRLCKESPLYGHFFEGQCFDAGGKSRARSSESRPPPTTLALRIASFKTGREFPSIALFHPPSAAPPGADPIEFSFPTPIDVYLSGWSAPNRKRRSQTVLTYCSY